ncbi:MAG: TRAP transporter TAXI family solute receptor [Planctomycetota bacterium]|jgi:TRAP transporter TAXI family solute receptor
MTTKPNRTNRRERANKSMRLIWAAAAVLTIIGITLLMQLVGPSPPKKITFASGTPGGAYHAFAEKYRDELAEQGVEVEVIDTDGSQENLELLASKRADVAFVQSGTGNLAKDPKALRGIASLYYEPLWIFQKGQPSITQLSEVAGKRLAIGNPRSGTYAVVKHLLDLNGITADDTNNTTLLPLEMTAARDKLLKGEIDYAFFIASPDASVIADLLAAPGIKLVGIKRHKAYVRKVLFVTDIEIAQGTFDLRNNIPSEDLVVLSTLATLVCQKELHPAIVELLTSTAHKLHSEAQALSRGGEFPSPKNLEFPIHEAANDYFQSGPSLLARYLPFWLANLLKKLLVLAIPILTLMLPLMKITPVVYKATMRKRIHRYYDTLDQIEDRTDEATTAAQFASCEDDLQRLTKLVESGIEVPSTFRNEEYDLRLHVAHVGEQLRKKRDERLADDANEPNA